MTFVAIRADASRAIGWGHVKRCLALAHALREAGASPILVSRPSDVAVDALCATAGVPLRLLPGAAKGVTAADDAAQTMQICLDAGGQRPAVEECLDVVHHHWGLLTDRGTGLGVRG